MEGKIKRLMDRGYGFIEAESVSYFFHNSDLKDISFDDLEEGNLVSFEPEESEKGKKAINIKKMEEI